MKPIISIAGLLLLLIDCKVFAQSGRDSVLLKERTIDRPLTLHKRQIRVSLAYGAYLHTRRFDEDGNSIRLSTEGKASVRYVVPLELKYGITDHFQFTVATSYISHTVRDQWHSVHPDLQHEIDINTVSEYSGLSDLFAGVDFRLPWTPRSLDVVLAAAGIVPLVDPTAKVPDHRYETFSSDDFTLVTVTRNNNYGVGQGVYRARPGISVKYRSSKFAATLKGEYDYALTAGVGTDWKSHLEDDAIQYRQESYTYGVPDVVDVFTELEYQPSPIFDIILSGFVHKEMNGWSDHGWGKVAEPDVLFINIGIGYEIIVTSRLWLRQRVQIPVAGNNTDAALGIVTSFSYNLFH